MADPFTAKAYFDLRLEVYGPNVLRAVISFPPIINPSDVLQACHVYRANVSSDCPRLEFNESFITVVTGFQSASFETIFQYMWVNSAKAPPETSSFSMFTAPPLGAAVPGSPHGAGSADRAAPRVSPTTSYQKPSQPTALAWPGPVFAGPGPVFAGPGPVFAGPGPVFTGPPPPQPIAGGAAGAGPWADPQPTAGAGSGAYTSQELEEIREITRTVAEKESRHGGAPKWKHDDKKAACYNYIRTVSAKPNASERVVEAVRRNMASR